MQINKNLTTCNYSTGSGASRINYIVIHYTANDGDTAYANTNYFKTTYRGSSAHYFVDENEVWQCVEDKNIAWHCGTSGTYFHASCRNTNSIGVELCSRNDISGNYYFKDETVSNAVELVKYLMTLYKVPVGNVIRHYDVTHKVCPAPFVNSMAAWNGFKQKLEVEDLTEAEARKIAQEEIAKALAGGDTPSNWATAEWTEAKTKGITDGTKPTGYTTREQVAAMIVRSGK